MTEITHGCPKCEHTEYIEKWVPCFPWNTFDKKVDGYKCEHCGSNFNDLISIRHDVSSQQIQPETK
jgi:transposase-like protein